MEQRLKDKQSILNALRTGKTGLELCKLYQDYFKKYCVSSGCIVDNSEKNGKIEKKPYDELNEPLLQSLL